MAQISEQVLRGVPHTLLPNQFSRVGYSFLGWSKDPSATEIEYPDEGIGTFNEDTTLYAVWKSTPAAYDLRIAIMPASTGTATGYGPHCVGDIVDISAVATHPDYHFSHWSSEVPVADKYASHTTLTMPSYDYTLTANFTRNEEWEIYEEGRGPNNPTSRHNNPVGYNFGTIGKSINKMQGQADEHTFTMQYLNNACGCTDSPLCYYWVKLARYPLHFDGTRATDKVTYYLVQKRSIYQDTDTIWHISNHAIINTGMSNPLYGEVTDVGFTGYPREYENFRISVDGKTQVTINATIDPNSGISAYSGTQTLKLLASTPGNAYSTGVSVGDNLQLFQIYRSYYNRRNGYWEVFAKNGQTYSYTVPLGSDSYTFKYTINNSMDDTIQKAQGDNYAYTVWQTSYPLYRLNDDGSITPMTYFYKDNGKEHGEGILDV